MVLSEVILENGEIGIIGGGGAFKYAKAVDLKAFYVELHDWLVIKKFKDTKGYGGHVKQGEFVENSANSNRTGDMFETEFLLMDHGLKKELEIRWEAKTKAPHSPYGSYIFKLNVVVRDLKEIEFLEGNNKKILQSGTWEFRNKLIYKNSIKKDFLEKIPFVKNSPKLQFIYMDRFYEETLYYDFMEYGIKKLKAGINSIINKHFT